MPRSWRRMSTSAGLLAAACTSSLTRGEEPIDFNRDVRPILTRHCFVCHGPDVSTREAGLRLDVRDEAIAERRRGRAIVPGDPGAGLLLERVTAHDPDERMPPDGRPALAVSEIDILRRWIAEGAPYAVHWSWAPLTRPEPPAPDDPAWRDHPVDRFIAATLDEHGLEPAPPADRATLVRRLHLDLIGLPPSPERVDAFVTDDTPGAWPALVDELLASPRFGERWARHWLDLVRYAETHGHEFDYPIRHAWRYRDYVIRAINADVPYDRFVTEHLAGDLIEPPRRHPVEDHDESIIATGFWFLGQATHGPVDVRGDEAERLDNQIDVFSKAFLGITVACARCHDHKFDPIATRDFYALAGILQSSRRQEAYLDPGRRIAEGVARLGSLVDEATPLLDAVLASDPDPDETVAYLAAAAEVLAAVDAIAAPPEDADEATRAAVAKQREARQRSALTELALTRWLDRGRLERFTRALRHAPLADAGHPVASLVAELRAERDAAPPAGETPPLPETRSFADFDDERALDDWFPSGQAWGLASTGPATLAPGDTALRIAAPGTAHSGLRGRRAQGTLRSPTFEIDADRITYRVSGRGRIRIIIDGYYLDEYNALLFEGLTFDVSTPADVWTVRHQDVRRYRGHRAYVELIDDTDDALVIDEIVFSDGAESALEPTPWIDGSGGDATAAERLAATCVAAVQRVRAGTANAGHTAVVSWMLAFGLTAGDAALEDLRSHGETLREVDRRLPAPVRVLAITEGTPEDEHVFVRGDHRTLGEVVPRGFIASLDPRGPFDDAAGAGPAAGSGRLELARRLLDDANPLPARVAVNRVWLHLFGEGLVPTPDDFGALGRPPTHPKLLDWLASWFRTDARWSTKQLVRLLVTSRAYRMSVAAADPRRTAIVDPQNRRLHRQRVRRLDAEAIRDAILAVSGELDTTMHGPPVPIHLTPFMGGRGRPGRSGPLDGDGRRSIYLEVRRNFLSPMLAVFDAPVPASTIGRRHRSNVPAQALALLNDPFVVEQAGRWAGRELAATGRTPAQRIESMYRRALGRAPHADELAASLAFLREQARDYGEADWRSEPRAWSDLAHVLVNTKEFIFVD